MAVQFDQQSILLVDDEEFSRALVSQMLRRIGFGEVLVADNGYTAMDVLNARKVTIVLSDFRMPGMHGLQLLKNIRTGGTKAVRNLPFAMLTGYADRNLVGLAIVLDINSFLAKPASLDTLAKRLAHCFQYLLEPLPIATYAAVQVDSAAPPATAAPLPPDEDGLLPLDDEILDLPPEPPAAKEATKKSSAPEMGGAKPTAAPAVPPASEPTTSGKRRVIKVSLSEVPENAMLARNLVGSSGTLLLGAGTRFKSRYIKRLEELSAINEKIDHVWIYEGDGA